MRWIKRLFWFLDTCLKTTQWILLSFFSLHTGRIYEGCGVIFPWELIQRQQNLRKEILKNRQKVWFFWHFAYVPEYRSPVLGTNDLVESTNTLLITLMDRINDSWENIWTRLLPGRAFCTSTDRWERINIFILLRKTHKANGQGVMAVLISLNWDFYAHLEPLELSLRGSTIMSCQACKILGSAALMTAAKLNYPKLLSSRILALQGPLR